MNATAAAGAWPRRLAAATVACTAAAALALPLAQPPALIGPLHVGAGIALAVALVHGVRAGAIALTALLLAQFGMRVALGQAVPAALSLAGAAAVAPALAMACARLFPPMDLDRPAVFLRFAVFGAALPALVAAVLAAVLGGQTGAIAAANRIDLALLWWFADVAGIVLAAPVTLVALHAAAVTWAQRRHVVAVPLVAVTGLLLIGASFLAHAEAERRLLVFQRDAEALAARVQARFDEYLSALHSVAGAFAASEDVTREEFRTITAYWLQRQPTLTAIGWSARIEGSRLSAFEQSQRRERPSFRVFDRDEMGHPRTPAPADEYVIVTYIEPEATNAAALGVNALSVAAPRAAIARALETGAPASTAPFRLTQAPQADFGMVVYLPAQPRGGPAHELVGGVAFVTLRLDSALADLTDPSLVVCLGQRQTGEQDVVLAGDARCSAATTGARHLERVFDFGGRPLVVQIIDTAEHRALTGSSTSRILAPMAGGLSALLAAFVLLAAGRAERVRRIVERRTEWLRRQMQQRRNQAEALRASEERLRRILNLAPIGITYTDPDGRFVYANPHFCAMLGHSAERLQTLKVFDIWHPQTRAENQDLRCGLLRGEPPMLRRTLRLLHADGHELLVEATAVVERDADGRPLRVLTVVEELSARLRLQEAERARQLAEEANRAKTEFLSRMSHELRTPLNAILGFAQLLELDTAQPLAPAQRERVQRIQEAGWHLLAMINDVLDLSRIESGTVRLSQETVDLTALVHEALAMQRDAAARAGLTVTEALDAAARYARGDTTRIRQVLSNLLSNAIKYNRAGGTICVVTERA
ncbi:MAG: CHASE domain-containing protein, partial [Burkholderiaceae bacterium]|nr:CHASE domain-containing protein [Burkholderiaceae bacterium]